MDRGIKWKKEESVVKPCSVMLPKLDLSVGDEVKVTIEWPQHEAKQEEKHEKQS